MAGQGPGHTGGGLCAAEFRTGIRGGRLALRWWWETGKWQLDQVGVENLDENKLP